MKSGDLDDIISSSPRSFYTDISTSNWHGRERGMVSLFALGHLSQHCDRDGSLHLTTLFLPRPVRFTPTFQHRTGTGANGEWSPCLRSDIFPSTAIGMDRCV